MTLEKVNQHVCAMKHPQLQDVASIIKMHVSICMLTTGSGPFGVSARHLNKEKNEAAKECSETRTQCKLKIKN